MQRTRENSRTDSKQFDNFGSFGFHGHSIFGEKDPFDDPFFSRPHGSLFGSDKGSFSTSDQINPKGPVIEELDSDDEGTPQHEGNAVGSAAWTNRNPVVEHPEDQTNDHGSSASKTRKTGAVSSAANQNKVVEARKPQSRSVSFQSVTYGGTNGPYYTATSSRRTGDDGVTLEEHRQADRTTGQATHRVSRGIHDKGLSVMRKLDPEGKVDTLQTLQNINEDEIAGFEQDWNNIAENHFHGWNDTLGFPRISGRGSPWSALGDPFRELDRASGSTRNLQQQFSSGRPKKSCYNRHRVTK